MRRSKGESVFDVGIVAARHHWTGESNCNKSRPVINGRVIHWRRDTGAVGAADTALTYWFSTRKNGSLGNLLL